MVEALEEEGLHAVLLICERTFFQQLHTMVKPGSNLCGLQSYSMQQALQHQNFDFNSI